MLDLLLEIPVYQGLLIVTTILTIAGLVVVTQEPNGGANENRTAFIFDIKIKGPGHNI